MLVWGCLCLQWAANRGVKREALLNSNTGDEFVDRMQTGLKVEDLLELLRVREEHFETRERKKQFDRWDL